ncbi:kinesin-like protein KIF18A isoform X2 [Acanthaster planci]|uniref:Kinesin-like protein KIF18A isoform X2 n=1 Tax=Acanthaster planci TaxID=133434 RepID=A0A8B7XPS4_ACAPL|nr:kinesin-like protein KIF18A isoform X2 [Acanthaster planci]
MPSSNHRRNSRSCGRPSSSRTTVLPASGNSNNESSKNGNIRVVVRIRPPSSAELDSGSGSRPIVQMLDEKVLLFDPKEDTAPSYFHGRRLARRNFMQRKNKDMKFAFDHVFGEGVSQQYVYENTTKTIVDSVLAGYNASVFAYGATGAGKTFTMLGGPDYPGVIFLTMVDLYRRIGEIAKDKLCDVAVSYLEVYNENIRDLLAPSGLLALREDPQQGVVVSGLTLHKPRSAEELLRMLEFGNGNRTQHPTDANAQSSRSHAVFQVFVRQKDRTANISTNFRIAKMSLIDLAGSERATVTTNRGARFREGANINRSLLALGNCINALADGNKSKGQHIPYRNSKLTRLLKDSLGGNCQTVMIAAISPSGLTYEDTLNTLKYASRAKNIQTKLKQNVVNVDLHISHYAQIVEELRTEVSELKSKLQKYESGVVKVDRSVPAPVANEEEIHRFQSELHKVFVQRGSIRKELLELESSDRHLTVMISRKQTMVERIRLAYGESAQGDKTMGRFERHIAASNARQTRLRERKPAVEGRISANQEWLEKVKGQMKADGEMPAVLQESLRTRHLEIELRDCRRQIKHLKRFARQQENHQQSSERLIVSLLATVRRQFFLLKGSGLATSDVAADFEAIQKQVEGDREVAWADQSVSEGSEVKPSGVTEHLDLNYLLELPIMKCVDTTPKVPSKSPRKNLGQRSSPRTPARRQNTPSKNQNPVLFERMPTPTQNRSPTADRARPQTPRAATPFARRGDANPDIDIFQPIGSAVRHTPSVGAVTRSTENGRTPIVCNTRFGPGVPQRIGQTVTKKQTDQPDLLSQTAEEPKCNLTETFETEGVAPLQSPATNATMQSKPTDNASMDNLHKIETDQLGSSSLNTTFSTEGSESTHRSTYQGPDKPVARAISFDSENALPNLKISPVTGKGHVMSYAEALATPQRLQVKDQQRAPLAALTNNSPQLQDRRSEAQHRVSNYGPTENQCSGNQSTSKAKRSCQRRGTFTKHMAPLHRRSKSQGVLGERTFPFHEAKHAETLHRFGLPSMSDQPTALGLRKPTPAYMSLTASAANKRRNHTKGERLNSTQENQPPLSFRGPVRLHRTESMIKPAVRIPTFSKSRSVSNLHRKIINP